MRTRRHHNNKGLRQIKLGKTVDQVKAIAKRLNIKYGSPMTDRRKKKTEFGADREADRILDKLPRTIKGLTKPNAFVWIDAAGRLQIAIDGGGFLSINERDLAYVHGDELV